MRPGGLVPVQVHGLWGGIGTPGMRGTYRTGIVELAPPKVYFECGRIRTVYIHITVEITITGFSVGTGAVKCTSSKIKFKGSSITPVAILIIIKISFTLTGIPAIITVWIFSKGWW